MLVNNANINDYTYFNFLDSSQVIGVHYFYYDVGYYRYCCKINIPSPSASYSVYLVFDFNYQDTGTNLYVSSFELSQLLGYVYTGIPDVDYGAGYDIGFQEGYNQGYGADAYQDGYQEGYDVGYDNGSILSEHDREIAVNEGYNAGYYEGRASGSSYSFMSLIGAVFDAPISALTGLLNFEILGTNMLSFFLSLMSLCIALFILKIVFK